MADPRKERAGDRPAHVCIVLARHRRGRPRVHHWHWPKSDIVNCERSREILTPATEDK